MELDLAEIPDEYLYSLIHAIVASRIYFAMDMCSVLV
uniref:Uncharacterized protein n=1 Tax=Arundo donax TaxID=35708 RepID=A0A0A8ZGP9_ARUDO